ncbi:MAG: ATP-binding cassette domain-containing protein [Bacteroidales bacterium]|nr:ATP-binding cassette domain-containing protein [Bacteroidales bacterium]
MARLEIEQLNIFYTKGKKRTQVIQDFNLTLPQGLIYAIVGPSGCGKSTLLYTIGGILSNYTGKIKINGESPNPKKQSIGLVPQHYGLLPWKRIKNNIKFPEHIRKENVDEQKAEMIIKQLRLENLLNQYPHEISGGEQQRVALARAFIQNPKLLLMDEPFSALDALTAEKSRSLFLEIWNNHPITTLLVTHNIQEAIKLAHKVILLSPAPGTIRYLLDSPTESEVREKIATIW